MRQIFQEAAELLRQGGWQPMNPVLAGSGNCLATAVAVVALRAIYHSVPVPYHVVESIVLTAIQIQTARRWRSIPDYNDAPGRTLDEVLSVLQIAAELASAEAEEKEHAAVLEST